MINRQPFFDSKFDTKKNCQELANNIMPVDFDDYSDSYQELLNGTIWLSGEKADYFFDYKLNCIKRWILKNDQAVTILDFGCGIGKLAALIAQAYPQSTIYGYDASSKSIETAIGSLGQLKNLVFLNQLPTTQCFDLIIVANVFHHIKQEDRKQILLHLRSILKPDGTITVFEHNPFNPITVHTVKTCPFDAGVELIRLGQFVKLATRCDLRVCMERYIVFFPKFLRFFRVIETFLGFLPLGAQYMISLRKISKLTVYGSRPVN